MVAFRTLNRLNTYSARGDCCKVYVYDKLCVEYCSFNVMLRHIISRVGLVAHVRVTKELRAKVFDRVA